MISNKLVERASKNTAWERGWIKEQMQGDALFESLANHQRDRAYVGRMLVAWTIVDGAPLIDTLIKVENISIGGRGLTIVAATVSAARGLGILKIGHKPKRVHDLDLYLWVPNYSEVRYAPVSATSPTSTFSCTVPLISRYQHPHALSQVEHRLYFASKSEFVGLWPDHNF